MLGADCSMLGTAHDPDNLPADDIDMYRKRPEALERAYESWVGRERPGRAELSCEMMVDAVEEAIEDLRYLFEL